MKNYTRRSPKTNRAPATTPQQPERVFSTEGMNKAYQTIHQTNDARKSAEAIIALLDEVATRAGFPRREVFLDFINLTTTMMQEMPRHLMSLRMTGDIDPEDPEPIRHFYDGIRERYKTAAWAVRHFAVAAGILASISTMVPQDTIGQIYQWAEPDSAAIVPSFEEALKKVRKALGDNPRDAVFEAMSTAADLAAESSPLARAVLDVGLLGGRQAKTPADQEWVSEFIANNALPAILPYYQPVEIYDPAVGTGAEIVAASTLFDHWMTQTGMVRFAGTDPDPVCRKMANLNVLIYGLNGTGQETLLAMTTPPGQALEDRRMKLFAPSPEEADQPQETQNEAGQPQPQSQPTMTVRERRARQITLLEQGE